ncbi:MAG: hypothetical protein VB934_13675, partial [Polyangiaceae bacterium]
AGGKALLGFLRDIPQPIGSLRFKFRAVDTGDLDGSECQQDEDCASRHCADGICCHESCGTCEQCSKETGTCVSVRDAPDDSCTAPYRCDAEGQCHLAEGKTCTDASECASGFCVDGVCCDAACDGSCDRCDKVAGSCTPLNCHPYACDGQRGCFGQCSDSTDCAPGLQCIAAGQCAAPTRPAATGGCACSWGDTRTAHPAPWCLGLGLLLWRRRQRRRITGPAR